ncbi:MAG: chemotaxis response regulator protein-glutamate methylesterase [Paracoccaceae bacterium]
MTPGAASIPRRVLIVDDSAAVRHVLSRIVGADPTLSVMGLAADPFEAARLMRAERPDVVMLDVEMPRMDGLTFLRRLMAQHPIPVVMCSSLMGEGGEALAEALALGAVEAICKPTSGVTGLAEAEERVRDAVRAATMARLPRPGAAAPAPPRPPAEPVAMRRRGVRPANRSVIAVGASTGGTEALRLFLSRLPPDAPPVVIVPHMPAGFTAAFARRLDGLAAIGVAEARDGERLATGRALIAPGGRHLRLAPDGAGWRVALADGALVSRHKPSVDVLFRSAAEAAGRRAVGVIMTGMGEDGAAGLLAMREAGARTLGQDEASSIVYGMPKAAMRLGAVERQGNPEALADLAVELAANTAPA